jgi:murein DD-endopeptidase MepM/ murein hydrolase activator NlpD
MKKASVAAAFAASLLSGSMSVAIAADDKHFDDARDGAGFESARVAEERLLGSADEDAQYLACQPFTREIAAAGVVAQSLDASLAEAGVPAAAMREARQALATSIDLGSDVAAGDRFYVRYEQTFTAEGTPIGVGRVMWAELRTKAKGTVALHRFRSQDGVERFWLASGEAATPPSMRLPLDTMTVSSGYGLRADPLDKPAGTALPMGPLPDPAKSVPAAYVEAPAPEQPVVAPREEPVKPARRPVRRELFPGQPGAAGFTMNSRSALDGTELQRLVAERDAEARRAAAARPVDVPSDTAAQTAAQTQQVAVAAPSPRVMRALFMHDGVDLVAATGTPVYAASDGIVIGAAPNGGYGNWIRIDHHAKLSTVYGHLSSFAPGIAAGARVSQGELIGFVGNTGRSTGSHLHFEILSNGKAVDPLAYPEIKRAQLRGADLERFRKQEKRALAERDRETVLALSTSGF